MLYVQTWSFFNHSFSFYLDVHAYKLLQHICAENFCQFFSQSLAYEQPEYIQVYLR